jgi:hypothetical protein
MGIPPEALLLIGACALGIGFILYFVKKVK